MIPYLIHSAKGTTWKDHKYVHKENGVYFYKDAKTKKDNDNHKIAKSNKYGLETLFDKIEEAKEYYENLADEKRKEYEENPLKFIMNNPDIVKAYVKQGFRKYSRQYINEFKEGMNEAIQQGTDYVKDKIDSGMVYAQNLVFQNENRKKEFDKDIPSNIDWTKKRN